MANIITSIREWFDRPTRAEVMTLARMASSKQGLKITAQLLQQTDTLTKRTLTTGETPTRSRSTTKTQTANGFMTFMPIVSSTPTSPAVSPSARGKVLAKGFPPRR